MTEAMARRARFDKVYLDHYTDVRRFIGRRLAAAEVEDATAEVFVVAWRRLDELCLDDPVLRGCTGRPAWRSRSTPRAAAYR